MLNEGDGRIGVEGGGLLAGDVKAVGVVVVLGEGGREGFVTAAAGFICLRLVTVVGDGDGEADGLWRECLQADARFKGVGGDDLLG